MYKNRQHSTEAECCLFCCPILLSRCRFCNFLKLLSYQHTANARPLLEFVQNFGFAHLLFIRIKTEKEEKLHETKNWPSNARSEMRADRKKENGCSNACPHDTMKDTKKTCGFCALQTVDKKLFSPRRGRIALSANERIAEFLDFAIQAKFAYGNKLQLPRKRGLF